MDSIYSLLGLEWSCSLDVPRLDPIPGLFQNSLHPNLKSQRERNIKDTDMRCLHCDTISKSTEKMPKKPKPDGWLIYDPIFGALPKEVIDRWKENKLQRDGYFKKLPKSKKIPKVRTFSRQE